MQALCCMRRYGSLVDFVLSLWPRLCPSELRVSIDSYTLPDRTRARQHIILHGLDRGKPHGQTLGVHADQGMLLSHVGTAVGHVCERNARVCEWPEIVLLGRTWHWKIPRTRYERWTRRGGLEVEQAQERRAIGWNSSPRAVRGRQRTRSTSTLLACGRRPSV